MTMTDTEDKSRGGVHEEIMFLYKRYVESSQAMDNLSDHQKSIILEMCDMISQECERSSKIDISEKYYNASIRVIKSHSEDNQFFASNEVIRYPMVVGTSKDSVKANLVSMHPEFFANGKIYERETKDTHQFFYVIISEVAGRDLIHIAEGGWKCDNCGGKHPNKYVSRPRISYKFEGTKNFCDEKCYNEFKSNHSSGDDMNYVNKDSLNYIYRITEKSSGKCYIGKTRNAPFFRWWGHLTHSKSPFGRYLRESNICDWNFEVLQILPAETTDGDVMLIESQYIKFFDSIENGFNKLVSNKNGK